MTTKPDTTNLKHEDFCLPRPDEPQVRIESYPVDKYGPDGVKKIGTVQVVRCIECGAATYDGVRHRTNA